MGKVKSVVLGLLLLGLTICFMGCGKQEETPVSGEDKVLIGVCVYNTDYEEMQLFMNYYRDYIESGMPVEFYFSETPLSGEDERAFIRSMKELGAGGIISFYGQDIGPTLELCREEEMYYVLGSGTISDEDFAAAKDNPWFLGVIGPSAEEEYQAGYNMAKAFAEKGAQSYLVLSGGADENNFMHASRLEGFLDALKEAGMDGDVTICPGYQYTDELTALLDEREYDAIAGCMSLGSSIDLITEKSVGWEHTVLLGTVDCFSESCRDAFREKDSFGESRLNYISGKYASMVGPAMAAVYNAVTGYPEAVRPADGPFRLTQGFWTASSEEEYELLYGYTQGVYENAYSCDELMEVIKVFNPDTTSEDFARLTEASDVESVEARISNRE